MALIGHVDHISRSVIQGWAFDTSNPGASVSLSIFVGGVLRGTRQTGLPRPDVDPAGGVAPAPRCGFRFMFDPPLPPFLDYQIEVKETWSAALLPNGQKILPRPFLQRGNAGRTPILITSTGRSGTTLLMSEFARCQDIVVAGEYPFEIKQIAYHAAAFRALVGDADRKRSTHPDNMVSDEMSRVIGSNPYKAMGLHGSGTLDEFIMDFFESQVMARYAAMFRSTVQDFYALLAGVQGKKSARYFCEKGDADEIVSQAARLFFGRVKEIVVLRDPRDLMCSSMAFWKLPPAEAMRTLRTKLPRLAQIAHTHGPDRLVVRYEDLVRQPAATRQAISRFLDLNLPHQLNGAYESIPSFHRTSVNPEASIGRWRQELPEELIRDCEAAFRSFLAEFDYETSSSNPGLAHAAPSVPVPAGTLAVVADGPWETAAFLEKTVVEDRDGRICHALFRLTFGADGDGAGFLEEGWSDNEPGYVWTNALESRLWLPPIQQPGEYWLHIAGNPFTDADLLPSQRVSLLIDGPEAGTAELRSDSVLVVPVPTGSACSGQRISLTIRVPDAASPRKVTGFNDDRLLGFALRQIALFRAESREEELAGPRIEPVFDASEMVDSPPWPALDNLRPLGAVPSR